MSGQRHPIGCFLLLAVITMCAENCVGQSAQLLPPADVRFSDPQNSESPDFQKHVTPLLGRLGCNGRSCHGSFQGRGGFRLSLFGYDFKLDHTALTGKASAGDGNRIDSRQPSDSLILRKPTSDDNHEGGQLFEKDSWEHRLLKQWIAHGANGVDKPLELASLDVEPTEVVFLADAKPIALRVYARWQDGSREDVTPLCRFRTNDDSVATVDENGQIQSVGRGDTHIIAFYDNGIAAVPVMRAATHRRGNRYPQLAVATKIDGFIQAKLKKLGVVPSELCSDTEFLRRIGIDLTGTLPTPDEVMSFLADNSPDKRRNKIEELLDRPAYAAWWTNRLCDFTGCNPNQQAELGQETSVQWYTWIYQRIHDNTPYDRLTESIVLAKSRGDGQSYEEYSKEMTACYLDESANEFSRHETMPHYWSRRSLTKSEDKALAFAHSFLGIRLQCAQCHKHPFAPWTQRDFQQFSSFFENVKFGVKPETSQRYRELATQVGLNVRGSNGSPVRKDVLRRSRSGATVPWREVYIADREKPATLSLLRDGVVDLSINDDPRKAIMEWMKQPNNPWFARAFVNRVWAGYFHVSIIDPPDNRSAANPPSHPKLLDWLTDGFIEHGYDMKWLHREIVLSNAYQRSWKPNDTNREDRRNFSRAIPRRIPAEIVYDNVKQAVAASDQLTEVRNDLSRRAIGHLSMRLAGTYAMHVFGKPERAVNCDCERVNKPTLLQSIFLHNDPLIEQRLEQSGWINEIADQQERGEPIDTDRIIRDAWLRTVSRLPSAAEQQRAKSHLSESGSVAEGVRDLLWALLNTKEFVLN